MTFEKFISLTPRDKIRSDPFVSRILYRPLSFYVGYILFYFNIRANQVSIFAICLVFPMCISMCVGWFNLAIAFAVIFTIADCIDGNLARVEHEILKNSEPSNGSWLDACSGYVFYAFFPISIGIYCEIQSDFFGINGLIQILASLVSVTNILQRLMYQKLLNVQNKIGQVEGQSQNKFILRFKGEVGFLGFMLPLFLIAYYTGTLELLLIFYLAIYSIGFLKIYLNNIYMETSQIKKKF